MRPFSWVPRRSDCSIQPSANFTSLQAPSSLRPYSWWPCFVVSSTGHPSFQCASQATCDLRSFLCIFRAAITSILLSVKMYEDNPPLYDTSCTGHRATTPLSRDSNLVPSPSEPVHVHGHFHPITDSLPNTKSSLDVAQHIERKLAEYNASESAFKRWLFEILCWLVSALARGTIIAIYAYLDGKLMAQASHLLSYANALGKVASAALTVPTSEALGQLKWNWFSKYRTIWDFEIFDKASR